MNGGMDAGYGRDREPGDVVEPKRDPDALTPKEEAFIRAFHQGANWADANPAQPGTGGPSALKEARRRVLKARATSPAPSPKSDED